MRTRTILAALLAVAPVAVQAQATAGITAGRMLMTSDGKRLGQIDRIVADRSGAPQSAAVIFDSRFVYIPASTLTSADNGRVTTSMTYKDVRKLP